MPWRVLLYCSVLAACGPGGGGPSSPTATPRRAPGADPSGSDRTGRWQNDVHQLATELAERHVDPFTRVSREVFVAASDALVEEVGSLSDPEVVVRMMALVALLGDSHTTLDIAPYAGFHQLPLELDWFSDGVFVTRADEAYREAVGRRVERVGTTSLEAAVAGLDGLAAYENESWRRVLLVGLLKIPEILQARGVVADATKVALTLAGPEAEPIELSVTAVPRGPVDLGPEPETLPLYRQHPEMSYWLALLDETQTLYVDYRRASDMASEPVAVFVARILDTLDREPVRTLVLDLRDNPGGNSSLLEPLLTGLESRPRWSSGEGVYTVIGRRTFSSGLINAYELKRRVGATLVGEPTGGKPNHFGEVGSFRLSESQLSVTYSTKFFRLIEQADPDALEPDVLVPLSSTDYFVGRDPVLEKILELAGR